jgi:hypothetical protein
MNLSLQVCLLFGATLSAATPTTIMGTVERVAGEKVYVTTGSQVVTLAADTHTEVWKGKIFHDFSKVEAGDEFIARVHSDSSGQLIAETVWLNIVNLSGVITGTGGVGFQMFTNPNADPQSAYRKENKTVEINQDTIFEASAREDLLAGRDVMVIGAAQRNGFILATRVTVYNGNRPVRMRPNAKVFPANGQKSK